MHLATFPTHSLPHSALITMNVQSEMDSAIKLVATPVSTVNSIHLLVSEWELTMCYRRRWCIFHGRVHLCNRPIPPHRKLQLSLRYKFRKINFFHNTCICSRMQHISVTCVFNVLLSVSFSRYGLKVMSSVCHIFVLSYSWQLRMSVWYWLYAGLGQQQIMCRY